MYRRKRSDCCARDHDSAHQCSHRQPPSPSGCTTADAVIMEAGCPSLLGGHQIEQPRRPFRDLRRQRSEFFSFARTTSQDDYGIPRRPQVLPRIDKKISSPFERLTFCRASVEGGQTGTPDPPILFGRCGNTRSLSIESSTPRFGYVSALPPGSHRRLARPRLQKIPDVTRS